MKETMCFQQDYLSTVCPIFPIKLIKTVRMRVRNVEPLLADQNLNLKVSGVLTRGEGYVWNVSYSVALRMYTLSGGV
jgi:hypothetical protein